MRKIVASLVVLGACAPAAPPPRTPGDIVFESHPYSRNFLPFGGGQFQNGNTAKGVGFAIGQGVTGAASAGIFLYLASSYRDGLVPIDEGARVNRLQRIEIATGFAFLGLYTWSVIDAIVHHEPWVRVRRSCECATLTPTAVPGGAGVALSFSR
jgi:hypothetical protein